MEHRNGSRKAVNLSISLQQGFKDYGWYFTKDIGYGGVSIKGNIDSLEPNSLVTVKIEYLIDGRIQEVTLRAFVIQQNLDCVGLMWAEENSDLTLLTERIFNVPYEPLFELNQRASLR